MTATANPALCAKSTKGRPPRIVGERKQALLNAIRAGNYYEAACHHARVAVASLYQWIKDDARAGHLRRALRLT